MLQSFELAIFAISTAASARSDGDGCGGAVKVVLEVGSGISNCSVTGFTAIRGSVLSSDFPWFVLGLLRYT